MKRIPVDLDSSDLPEGVILRRRFHGVEHVVDVIRAPTVRGLRKGWWRYRYRGRLYKTLSAIARVITGDRYMAGNRFFGLRARRRGIK